MEELAARLRETLERLAPASGWGPDFPTGYCVHATAVLCRLLTAAGYPAVAVEGEFLLDRPAPVLPGDPTAGTTLSHAHYWVLVGDLVVDITGDQFNPYLNTPWPPVYLGLPQSRYVVHLLDPDLSPYREDHLCLSTLEELT